MAEETNLVDVAGRLGKLLQERKLVCSTAESCTGGLVATSVTDIAGSSAWFEQGWVTYSNEAKIALLGVPAELLEKHGAVSREVVESMAAGAVLKSGADISVAVSGIAGPGGATPGKPVGTVWLAWHYAGISSSECCLFQGDRRDVRLDSATRAIIGMIERVQR